MALSTRTAALDDALVWYKSLRDTSNTAFLSLYNDRHRYLVLKGGAGSFAGKRKKKREQKEEESSYAEA